MYFDNDIECPYLSEGSRRRALPRVLMSKTRVLLAQVSRVLIAACPTVWSESGNGGYQISTLLTIDFYVCWADFDAGYFRYVGKTIWRSVLTLWTQTSVLLMSLAIINET